MSGRKSVNLSKIKVGKYTYWAKVIDGKRLQLGNVKTTTEAEARRSFLLQLDTTENGGFYTSEPAKATLADLLNEFYDINLTKCERGQISERTLDDYKTVIGLILDVIDKRTLLSKMTPRHFDVFRNSLDKTKNGRLRSPKRVNIILGYARTIFRFAAVDGRLIDRPLPFAGALAALSKKNILIYEAKLAKRHFSNDEICLLYTSPSPRDRG